MKVFQISFAVFLSLLTASAPRWASARSDDLLQLVVTLLSDPDKDVRALGLEQVRSEAKGEAATKQFAALLATMPPEAQVGLLGALADRGDAAARSAVLDLLEKTKNDPVRVAALAALGPLGEVADVKRLTESLAAVSKDEKAAARASLVRLSGEAAPAAIVGELKRSPPPIQAALIEVLAARRALSTIPDLLELAAASEKAARAAAMTALGQLASPELLPGMVRGVLAAEAGGERAAAEKAVALVCHRIANESERSRVLVAAVEKLADDDKRTMLSTLGRVGGQAALRVVEAAIADPKLHDAGIGALCNWPDASTAERLIEVSQKDEHPAHRSTALAALIRVAPLPDKRPDAERLALVARVKALCTTDDQRNLILSRARAIRTVDALRFVAPYLDSAPHAQAACETIVELAHHRTLREASKAEFHAALDRVIQTSKDATVVERANRYKKNQTWARPTPGQRP